MAKKSSIKVRLVPESKPNSPYFYYVKKPSMGEKAKIKLKVKKQFGGNLKAFVSGGGALDKEIGEN